MHQKKKRQLARKTFSSLQDDPAKFETLVVCFLLDQQIGLDPKLRVYLKVELQYVPSPTQYKYVNPMRSNAKAVI
jgi:hypothetical protein